MVNIKNWTLDEYNEIAKFIYDSLLKINNSNIFDLVYIDSFIENRGDFIMLSINNDSKRFCIVPYESNEFLCMIEITKNNWMNIKNINDLIKIINT